MKGGDDEESFSDQDQATDTEEEKRDVDREAVEPVEERRQSVVDSEKGADASPGFAPIKPTHSRKSSRRPSMNGSTDGSYSFNPFDLDRVNTRDSFKRPTNSRKGSFTSSKTGKSRK